MVAVKKNSKLNSKDKNEDSDKIMDSKTESSSKTSLRRSLRCNKNDEANGNDKDLKKKNIEVKTITKSRKTKASKDKDMVQINNEGDLEDTNSTTDLNSEKAYENEDNHQAQAISPKGVKAKATKKGPIKGKKLKENTLQDANEITNQQQLDFEVAEKNLETLSENDGQSTTNKELNVKDDELSTKESDGQATSSLAKKSVKKEPVQKKRAKIAVESKEVVEDDHNGLDEKSNVDQTNGKEADHEDKDDEIPQTNGISDVINLEKTNANNADVPKSRNAAKKGPIPRAKRAKKEVNGNDDEPAKEEDLKMIAETIAPNDDGTEIETVKANGKKRGKKATTSKATKDEENVDVGDGDKKDEVKSSESEKGASPKDNHYEIYKGRNWKKNENAPKLSAMKTGAAFHKKWSKRMEEKEALSKLKETQKSIEENKAVAKAANAKRKEVNAQRKQQNERKSEVVQVIKDPTKIKKMKKKHLRALEKRDVTY